MNYRQTVRVVLVGVVHLAAFGAIGVGALHGAYGKNVLPTSAYYLAGLLFLGFTLVVLYWINRSYLTCDNCGAQTLPLRMDGPDGWLEALVVVMDTSGSRFPDACPRCGSPRPDENERRLSGWVGRLLSAHCGSSMPWRASWRW